MIRPHLLASIVCVACSLSAATPTPHPDPALARAGAALARLPLRFEANQGQFAAPVRYAARGANFTLLLSNQGPTLSFPKSAPVRLSLLDSNPWPLIEPVDRLAAPTDYFTGRDQSKWHTGVASFKRVRYQAVYPGIDIVYYGTGNQLEYDFILQPGADPSAIKLKPRGASGVYVTPEGDLALVTREGLVLQKQPVIYQEVPGSKTRRAVNGRYVLQAGNVVTLKIDRYDRKLPLVVDPVIVYSTLIGGTQTDQVTALKLSPDGSKLYVLGYTQTGDITVNTVDFEIPTMDRVYDALTDTFLQVIDLTSGNYEPLYSTFIGGANLDFGLAMDVDSAGFIYITGSTTSPDFPITPDSAFQTAGAATSTDAFICKIDPNAPLTTGATLVFSSYLGGAAGNETGRGIQIGPDGNINVVGVTKSPDFPTTDNAFAASLFGPSDVFVTKIDGKKYTLMYSSFIGSESDDTPYGMAVDSKGLIYFAASTLGAEFPMAGFSYNGNTSGFYDVVVDVIDPSKTGADSLVYGTYFGGSQNDEVRGMTLDPKGRVVITGYTNSPDFPVTAATAVQPTNNGNGDAYVAVLDTTKFFSQSLIYSTFLGGSEGDLAYAVATDAAGFLYVTGYTLSPDFPVVNAIQPNWGQGIDMFLAKINPAVKGLDGIQFATYIGIDSLIVGNSLAIGADQSIWVGGYAEGYLPLLGTPLQQNYGGGFSDGFYFLIPGPAASQNSIPRNVNSDRVPARTLPRIRR